MIEHLILSILFGVSFSILLIEKGDDWPVSLLTGPLKLIFGKIYHKLPQMLECTVCASFWTTLVGEMVLFLWVTKSFLWPFTGVIALGITWFVIEFLNALDKSQTHDKPN